MPNQYYNFDESAASMSMSMSTYEYPSFDSSSSSYSPSSSPYVDCTLSLGTPSTHLHNHNQVQSSRPERHRSAKNHSPSSTKPKNNLGGGSSHNDPIFARRCANCDTTSTPLWRNGPRGPKSLCNACGIRFKKEERRAAAAAAAAAANSQSSEFHQHSYSWSQQYSQAPSTANEYMFMGEDEDGRDSSNDSNVPFFSWCLNVADRGSFVDEYTTY